jgi:surface polysaccharide O-acyltransferase-like enzyme
MDIGLETNMERTFIRAKRSLEIDVCKTVAIIGVVVIHTCIVGYSYDIGSFNWVSSLLWGSISRASVPLFFMCSGALLLAPEKDLPVRKLFSKNLLRICTALFFWAFAYKGWHLLISRSLNAASIWQAIKETLLFSHEPHLYYLHILILVYLFVPVTRVFVKSATRRQMQYALAFWFAFGILYPTVITFWPFTLLTGIPVQWKLNMTYAAIGYGLLGYDLKAHPIRSRKISALLGIAGLSMVFFGTWFLSMRQGKLYQHFLSGMTLGVCLLAVGIYSACFQRKKEYSPRAAKFLRFSSEASFCIFLIHIFWISCFGYMGFTVKFLPCILSIPIIAAANILLSTIAYLVISRIPILKQWVI